MHTRTLPPVGEAASATRRLAQIAVMRPEATAFPPARPAPVCSSPRMPSTRVLGMAAAVLLTSPLALAGGGRPKLEAYFQQSLTDVASQQKVFARVAKAWKAPPLSKVPQPGKKAVVQAVI